MRSICARFKHLRFPLKCYAICFALVFLLTPSVTKGSDASEPQQNKPDAPEEDTGHHLYFSSYLDFVANPLGGTLNLSLSGKLPLYKSDNIAFRYNYFKYGITQETKPTDSRSRVHVSIAPASFFILKLEYAFIVTWFFARMESMYEDYKVDEIPDRIAEQGGDMVETGHNFSIVPTLQFEFGIGDRNAIRFLNEANVYWYRFDAIYYDWLTSLLYDRKLGFKNTAHLLHMLRIGKRRQIEWMIGISDNLVWTPSNNRYKHNLGPTTIFLGLPFFGNGTSFLLIHIGAWLHNEHQDQRFIPGTPLELLLVYGIELELI